MSSSNSTEHLADSKLTSPASPVSETESKEQDLTRTSTESIIQESSEELIPLMDVVSVSETPKIKSPKPLKRTFSVDHGSSKMKSSTSSRKFGSQETIAQQPKKTLPSSSQLALRRQSVDKFSRSTRVAAPRKTSDPTIAKKTEKGIATESRPQLSKVESRVDSIRRVPPKPRSQIVAAVTSRLYAKTNKKDVGTDTLDMAVSEPTEVPKELTICSNARLRLKELTRRALKAHRSKHEETQTDLFPVMRLKETSTDVVDLKIELQEVRDVETSTNIVETDDKETTCALDGFAEDTNSKCQHFVVTRSCGTQSMCPGQMCPKDSPQTNLSFTKYLMDVSQTGTHSNSSPSQSVYTGSVNINICHNYINGHKGSDSVSDDSLDEHNSNVCFPTPDLISNHNSLETHAHATTAEVRDCFADRICHANHVTLQDQLEVTTEFLLECNSELFTAKCSFTPEFEEILNSADIPCVCAPEICITASELLDQKCQSFSTIPPPPARPSIIETKTYSDDCVTIMEPVVLKSIMKNMPECSKDEDFPVPETEALDSLDYHMANAKKVHFTKSKTCRNEHMFKAMSGFLQEATTLMNNLTSAVSNLDSEYEVQVTVNDISGLGHRRKRKRKPSRCSDAISQTESTLTEDEYVQTQPAAEQHTNYTQCEDFELPHNKYELLLEDSVRRLEEKIDSYENNKNSYSFVAPPEEGQQPLLFNRWDGNDGEDTSLESTNMTCSDYGSLPRRLYRRCYRTPSSSPSALLRQLATMRRQVVDSSRNELHSDYKHFPHFFADDTE